MVISIFIMGFGGLSLTGMTLSLQLHAEWDERSVSMIVVQDIGYTAEIVIHISPRNNQTDIVVWIFISVVQVK